MKRTNWVDRKFNFDIPKGWLINTISRLEGTTIILKSITSDLSDKQLSHKLNRAWSIKEHIGHLTDLEDLHIGRVIDFSNRKEILRAADMSNKQTHRANHNEKSIDKLIDEFDTKRKNLVKSLKNLDNETQHLAAMHPRLKEPMKPVDMAFFTAEHDNHHITSINLIIELFK